MAISVVQNTSFVEAKGVLSLQSGDFPNPVTAGNTIVVCCFGWSGLYSNTLYATDTLGNLYHQAIVDSGNGLYTATNNIVINDYAGIFYSYNIAGGNNKVTMQVQADGGDSYFSFMAVEVSGIIGNALDSYGYGHSDVYASAPNFVLDTVASNTICFACFGDNYADAVVDIGNIPYGDSGAWTQLYATPEDTSYENGSINYVINTNTTLSGTQTWIMGAGNQSNWYAVAVSFAEYIPPVPTSVVIDYNTGLPIIAENGWPAVPTIAEY